jgi:hypothetical protein
MIQVRDTFQIRFGKIDQARDHFSRLLRELPEGFLPGESRFELLSDLSGPMYTLRECLYFDSLQGWEDGIQTLFARPEYDEWFKDWKQFVVDGAREFFRVEMDSGTWSTPGAVVVRSSFHALEWRLHDAVSLLKDHGAMLVDCGVGQRPRVLTDASGRMFQVVQEIETPDLQTWQEHRLTMFNDPSFQAWFQRLLTCVSHGSNEFYTVVA